MWPHRGTHSQPPAGGVLTASKPFCVGSAHPTDLILDTPPDPSICRDADDGTSSVHHLARCRDGAESDQDTPAIQHHLVAQARAIHVASVAGVVSGVQDRPHRIV